MITKEFILSELSKTQTVTTSKGTALICCPFHDDHNPSMGVSLGNGKVSAGIFNCFSCKAKGGWNVLASKLGLTTVGSESNLDKHYFVNKTKIKLFKPIDKESLTLIDIDTGWRRYSKKFLKKFKVKKMWHDKFGDYYLYFPFTYLGEDYGFIRTSISKDSYGPKYWFNVREKLLYPIDYLLQFSTPVVVIVEGLADCLRLLKYGIPALASLGTVITKFNYELIEMQGIEKIIFCYDGDEAGKKAVIGYDTNNGYIEGQAAMLTRTGYDVRVLFPPKGKDPDNMPYKYIKILKNMVLSMGGNLI